jgi:ribonuclease D
LQFSLKTNIDFNRIIKQNSIIDLSKIANEDLKALNNIENISKEEGNRLKELEYF